MKFFSILLLAALAVSSSFAAETADTTDATATTTAPTTIPGTGALGNSSTEGAPTAPATTTMDPATTTMDPATTTMDPASNKTGDHSAMEDGEDEYDESSESGSKMESAKVPSANTTPVPSKTSSASVVALGSAAAVTTVTISYFM